MAKVIDDHWTELDQLFHDIGSKGIGRAKQKEMCEAFLADDAVSGHHKCLASLFARSLAENARRPLIDQPFVKASTLRKRKALSSSSRGANKISYLLSKEQVRSGCVRVLDGPKNYEFEWINREIPPFRQENAGKRFSGAGGIDYTAVTLGGHARLVLGEIKYSSKSSVDKNAFYAFVQLLWYLSRIATDNQIKRAQLYSSTECGGFGVKPMWPQRFDLHILLVDFHLLPKSTQTAHQELIALTKTLVERFMRKLQSEVPRVVGKILCLRMDSAEFAMTRSPALGCDWYVP